MKKFFGILKDEDSIEKIVGGVFGAVAIVAAIVEMAIGGFDSAAVAGGVKDIAGTLITIVMLVVAINALRPKTEKITGFNQVFELEMNAVMEKYDPMVTYAGLESSKSFTDMMTYKIANKLDCVSGNASGAYNKLFRVKEGATQIDFSVSETVFPGRRESVAALIAGKIAKSHGDFIGKIEMTQDGFKMKFDCPLVTDDDARELGRVVDHILLLYLAEFSRKQ